MGVKEDMEADVQKLEPLIATEFKAIGFSARPSDVAALADALAAQAAEYDEVSIMAACIAYGTAKGMSW